MASSHNAPSLAFRSFWGTALFTSLLYSFFVPYYATNDDTFMVMILRGVGFAREPSTGTLYLNALLETGLSHLYRRFPDVPWFAFFLAFTAFLTFWVAAQVLGRLAIRPHDRILVGTLLPTAFLPFFVQLQWTSLSVLAAGAGFLGLASSFRRDRDILPAWLGLLLLVLSGLIRSSGLGLGLLALFPFGLSQWSAARGRRRDLRILLAITIAALATLWIAQATSDARHPDLKNALRYAQLRARITQFVLVPFNDRTEPLFRKIGWDRLDYQMFFSFYGGIGRYDLKHLEQLDRLGPESSPRPWGVLFETFRLPAVLTLLAGFLLLLLPGGGSFRRIVLIQALWIVVLILALFFFLWAPFRVTGPMLVLLLLVTAFHRLEKAEDPAGDAHRNIPSMIISAGLGILLLISLLQRHSMDRVFRHREAGFRSAVTELRKSPGSVVLFWGNGIHVDWIRAFDDLKILEGLDLYPTGWLQASPPAEAMRARYGLADPLRDLIDRRDVLVAPSNALPWDLYRSYAKEKYGLDVMALRVVDGMGCRVYRVVTAGRR